MYKIIALIPLAFCCTLLQAQSKTEKIDALLAAHAKNGKFNGSVLVAHKGVVLLEKGYGLKNASGNEMNEATTIYQIGSVTKQFTAAVIMKLEEQQKLSVNDKLSKYFPLFPQGDSITIRQLLSHTSGIYNYTNDTALMRGDVTIPRTEAQMIALFQNRPLSFSPGAEFEYSNSGYSLLGYIIQRVTGKPYEKVVREMILQPLNMTSSGFDFSHLSDPNKAKGYFALNGSGGQPAPVVDSTIAYSAGSLYSTVGDLHKWERSIGSNRLLRAASWKTTFTPVKRKYGYGWNIDTAFGRSINAHSGGIHGFTSFLLRFPEEDLVVVLLSNASSGGLNKIARSAAAIVLDQPYEMLTANVAVTVDSAALVRYTGVYKLAPAFDITITLKENSLWGQATGQPAFQLFPKSLYRFFLKAVEAEVEFTADTKGAISELTLFQNGRALKGTKIQ